MVVRGMETKLFNVVVPGVETTPADQLFDVNQNMGIP